MTNRLKGLFFCLIALSAIFLFLPKQLFAQNLLYNPGFEELLFNWEPSSGLEIALNFTTSSYVKKSGEYSALIRHSKTGSYGARQIVKNIVGEENYSAKGYVLFNNEKAKSARIRIAWYSSEDGSGTQIKTNDSNIVDTPSSSWQVLDIGIMEAPSSAKSAEFRILLASIEDGIESLVNFDDLSFEVAQAATPTPTTTAATQTPTPSSYSDIYISEFLPYPENSDEWVELYNDNDFEVILNGWYIDDIENDGSSPKQISGTVSSKSYKQFFLLSNAYLNNSGDDVRLLNGSQDERDATSFETSTQGKSWSKDNDGDWCQRDPTPNASNPDCPVEGAAISSLTPTPTPLAGGSPTPTKKPTPKPTPTLTPTPTGEILGEEATPAAEEPTPTPMVLGEKTSNPVKFIPFVFIGLGSLLLLTSGGFILSPKLKMKYNHLRKSGEGEKII